MRVRAVTPAAVETDRLVEAAPPATALASHQAQTSIARVEAATGLAISRDQFRSVAPIRMTSTMRAMALAASRESENDQAGPTTSKPAAWSTPALVRRSTIA